jgi:N utilization substance protein B
MGKRRKARESALQILFQLEFNDTQVEEIIAQFWKDKKSSKEIREYATWLVKGIITHREEINKLIQSISDHWRLSRMALIDRNILRTAVFELLYEENIAPAVVINEAIEIAKKYSNDEAAAFVNGILDAVRKKLEKGKHSSKERKR